MTYVLYILKLATYSCDVFIMADWDSLRGQFNNSKMKYSKCHVYDCVLIHTTTVIISEPQKRYFGISIIT